MPGRDANQPTNQTSALWLCVRRPLPRKTGRRKSALHNAPCWRRRVEQCSACVVSPMEPKELWNLAVLILVWYVANLGFNVGMKRSHALVPDVLVLTAFQFCAGAIAFGGAY